MENNNAILEISKQNRNAFGLEMNVWIELVIKPQQHHHIVLMLNVKTMIQLVLQLEQDVEL